MLKLFQHFGIYCRYHPRDENEEEEGNEQRIQQLDKASSEAMQLNLIATPTYTKKLERLENMQLNSRSQSHNHTLDIGR
jgi:hypothetical protein